MKQDTALLDKLFAASNILAALAWLATVIALGVLNRSFTVGLFAAGACALYVVGYFKKMDPKAAPWETSKTGYRNWFIASGVSALVSLAVSNFGYWWLWLILAVFQVPPYVVDAQITKKVWGDAAARRAKQAEVEDRARRVQAAAQSTSVSEFASALGMKVIDMRSEQEKAQVNRAAFPLDGEDEDLAQRLVAIFREADRLYNVDKEACERKRQEARQIGQRLGDNGGDERMTLVAYRVQALGGRTSDCERAWEGICGWMP